jgi:hypothetical protein
MNTAFYDSTILLDSSLDPSSASIFFMRLSLLRKIALVLVSTIMGYSYLSKTALA